MKNPYNFLNYSRAYVGLVSLPIGSIAFLVMCFGIASGAACWLNFVIQILVWLTKDVWIPQTSPSDWFVISAAQFRHIDYIFGETISGVFHYAYISKLMVSALVFLFLGSCITALNFLNLYLLPKLGNGYFLLTSSLMFMYYYKVASYVL
jgi:hypothetical protein